jgi:hypothetical protein
MSFSGQTTCQFLERDVKDIIGLPITTFAEQSFANHDAYTAYLGREDMMSTRRAGSAVVDMHIA